MDMFLQILWHVKILNYSEDGTKKRIKHGFVNTN